MIAVIMICYGEHELTDAALGDFAWQPENMFDLYLIDNKGDYVHPEHFSRPNFHYVGSPNLRWLRGTNFGTEHARKRRIFEQKPPYDGYMWMNNDVRISPNFLRGLDSALKSVRGPVGIVAPAYDHVWPQQCTSHYRGAAAHYVPRDVEREVPFVDGAGFYVDHNAYIDIGPMDSDRFGRFGWGGDFDYCIRMRQAGFKVVVTERCYFNHLGGATNKLLEADYHGDAGGEMTAGMIDKYGEDWRRLLD